MENMAAAETVNAAKKGVSAVEAGIRKVWSLLEAAEQKKAPGQVLSPQGIRAVQGGPQGS